MTYVLVALAIALVLWPAQKEKNDSPLPFDIEAVQQSAPTYQSSHVALAHVRLRLLQTEHLGDDERKAIEVLTLALVAGSDKQ
jgi:hypothetical protein